MKCYTNVCVCLYIKYFYYLLFNDNIIYYHLTVNNNKNIFFKTVLNINILLYIEYN